MFLHIPNRRKRFFGLNITTDELLTLLGLVCRARPRRLAQSKALRYRVEWRKRGEIPRAWCGTTHRGTGDTHGARGGAGIS